MRIPWNFSKKMSRISAGSPRRVLKEFLNISLKRNSWLDLKKICRTNLWKKCEKFLWDFPMKSMIFFFFKRIIWKYLKEILWNFWRKQSLKKSNLSFVYTWKILCKYFSINHWFNFPRNAWKNFGKFCKNPTWKIDGKIFQKDNLEKYSKEYLKDFWKESLEEFINDVLMNFVQLFP